MRRLTATCVTLVALVLSGCALRAHTKTTHGLAGPLSWSCASDDRCTIDRIDHGGQPHPLMAGAPLLFSRPRRRAAGILETRGNCGPSCTVNFFADLRTRQISSP